MNTYLAHFPFGALFGLTFIITGVSAAIHFVRRKPSPSFSWLLLRAATVGYVLLFLFVFWFPTALRGTRSDTSLLPLAIQQVPLNTVLNASPLSVWGISALLAPLPVLVYFHVHSIKRACVVAFSVAVLIEPVQLLVNVLTGFPNFVVDVDDTLLQLLGCLAGMLVIVIGKRLMKSQLATHAT